MKTKLYNIALAILVSLPLFGNAQDSSATNEYQNIQVSEKSNEYKTLFGGSESAFGGYFGFNSHYTKINDQDALLLGGEFTAVINHSFNIGFKGYGMVSSNKSSRVTENGEQLYLALGYGGLTLEPVLFYNSAIHVSLPVLLGAGGIAEYSKNHYYDHHYYYFEHYNSDYFFLIEPGVAAEVNLTKFMRLSTGVSYRVTSAIDIPGMINNDLNGFNFDLSLKFGWF